MALAHLGQVVEVRTLTRCCVENVLWLGRLVAEGDAFVQEMAADEVKSRLKRADLAASKVKLDESTLAKLRKASGVFKERWPKAKILSPSSVAKNSKIENIYLLYSQFSADAAHPTLSALERYIVQGTDSDKIEFRGIDLVPEGRPGELVTTVQYACIALMGACVAFNDLVGPTEGGRKFILATEEFEALKAATGIG